MSVSIFEHFLTTPDMIAVFDDAAIVQAMLQFEAALAKAQAAEGIIPETAARDIASVCNAQLYNIPVMVNASRRAGSLAIPLVKELTKTVGLYSEESATHVHWGSTSQDVIDTAMVLATRQAISLIERDLQVLIQRLMQLAEQHLHTPILARTLMQPAQVTSFGFKLLSWLAPLVRAREQLRQTATRALALQLGGAVGTLAVMGAKGPAVAQRMAADLGLTLPPAAWHTQRDEWVRLGLEVTVLVGSMGKIATDLSLLAQGEIAELAEPSGKGRGGSSAMPHKRNPVSCMIALAAAARAPQRAAALLANMGQEHERGLGNWQAELAEWPDLFLSAHGAVNALSEAMAGLQVDTGRMLTNIDALQGLVFAESISIYLASVIGRPKAHSLMEILTQKAVADHTHLLDVVTEVVRNDARLSEVIDLAILQKLFDPRVATEVAAALASTQLAALRQGVASKHI